MHLRRVVVVGNSASGKSTFAAQLARKRGLKVIEPDGLRFVADWQMVPEAELRRRVRAAIAAAPEGWVFAGNYRGVRDIVWAAADTVIWLDMPFPLILWRVLRRTWARVTQQQDLWGTGNRETWRTTFSRESIVLWVFTAHGGYQRDYRAAFARPHAAYAHLTYLRLGSPRAARAFLERL